MLYVHAHTAVENEVYRQLKSKLSDTSQLNVKHLHDKQYLERHNYIHPSKTLFYSFLDYSAYDYLPSFQEEVVAIELLLEFALENNYEHFIVLTYPGVYYNAGNLFSQHKAIIQQKIAQSGVNYTMLAVNALSSFEKQIHSFYSLCYNQESGHFVVPHHRSKVIYNLEIENLIKLITLPEFGQYINRSYELFDSVYSFSEFLELYSDGIPVKQYPTTIFSLLSFIRGWHTPSMIELLTKPLVTMQRNLVERDYGLSLQPSALVNGYLWRTNRRKTGKEVSEDLLWNSAF